MQSHSASEVFSISSEPSTWAPRSRNTWGCASVRPDAVVVTDELLLHRLLGNLIANAIRYTSEGNVMVCARRRGDDIQIEVRDSGVGIPADKHREIFQEFYQVGNPSRDRGHGLGLGLAIVSRLAACSRPDVKVRSAQDGVRCSRLRVPGGKEAVVAVDATVTRCAAVPGSERIVLPF
jgi:K+-sensing histidine kinase KdpD